MAYKVTDVNQLIEIMHNMQAESGISQAQYAQSINISPQYLCDIYAGRREPGDKVLTALGVSIVRSAEYTIPEKLISYTAASSITSPVEELYRKSTNENQDSKEKGSKKRNSKGKRKPR